MWWDRVVAWVARLPIAQKISSHPFRDDCSGAEFAEREQTRLLDLERRLLRLDADARAGFPPRGHRRSTDASHH